MSTKITNAEFLERYHIDNFDGVILPQEVALVEKKLAYLAGEQARIIQEKVEVTGGDDWHDGAFRATDNEAKIVVEQAGKLGEYLRSTIIEYPEPSETRVTLGSRVTLNQDGDVFDVEIVGVPLLHEPDDFDEVLACSIESPMAKGIIGKEIGYIALLKIGNREQHIELIKVDQEAMNRFLNDEISKQ